MNAIRFERFRDVLRSRLPQSMVNRYRTARLVGRARQLGRLAAAAGDHGERWNLIWGFEEFRPFQRKSELLALLDRVSALHPATICEIGAASGGTLCALAHAATGTAVIVSLDCDFTAARLAAFPHLGRAGQTIVCVDGDSHDAQIRDVVTTALKGRMLDVLFVDGDHHYEGVRADFETYRSLVRPGGLIAFHDIVPDFKTRFDAPTSTDVGGVPRLWRELKARYPWAEEIVEDPDQDGYGIGLLRWRQPDPTRA
jgi:predicted O-methyltransferase YrrM